MKANNEVLFITGNVASLDIRSQIVEPSQPAALPAPLQTRSLGEISPPPLAVEVNKIGEDLVFPTGPRSLVQPHF